MTISVKTQRLEVTVVLDGNVGKAIALLILSLL